VNTAVPMAEASAGGLSPSSGPVAGVFVVARLLVAQEDSTSTGHPGGYEALTDD